jgi:hypothetical protein
VAEYTGLVVAEKLWDPSEAVGHNAIAVAAGPGSVTALIITVESLTMSFGRSATADVAPAPAEVNVLAGMVSL